MNDLDCRVQASNRSYMFTTLRFCSRLELVIPPMYLQDLLPLYDLAFITQGCRNTREISFDQCGTYCICANSNNWPGIGPFIDPPCKGGPGSNKNGRPLPMLPGWANGESLQCILEA